MQPQARPLLPVHARPRRATLVARLLALLLGTSVLTACPGDSARLVVAVEGSVSQAIFQLAVRGLIAGAPVNLRVPNSPREITLPTSFGLSVAEDAAGQVAIDIDALAEDGISILASGSASGQLEQGKSLTVKVVLGAPRPQDAGVDGSADGTVDSGGWREDVRHDLPPPDGGAVDGGRQDRGPRPDLSPAVDRPSRPDLPLHPDRPPRPDVRDAAQLPDRSLPDAPLPDRPATDAGRCNPPCPLGETCGPDLVCRCGDGPSCGQSAGCVNGRCCPVERVCGRNRICCPTSEHCDSQTGTCRCDDGTCRDPRSAVDRCVPFDFPACGRESQTSDMCALCDPALSNNCAGSGCGCGRGLGCVPGQRCDGTDCVCDQSSCPDGCCLGNECKSGFPLCRSTGSWACVSCDPIRSDHCLTGGGCACGRSTQPCLSGQHCVGGTCTCDSVSCPDGCCNDNNACETPVPPRFCRQGSQCRAVGGRVLTCRGDQTVDCVSCDTEVADTCDSSYHCSCGGQAACADPRVCDQGSCCLPLHSTCSSGGDCCTGSCGRTSGCCVAASQPCSVTADCCTGTCVSVAGGNICRG